MGGGGQQQVQQTTTTPTNPKVTQTVDQILGGVQAAQAAGAKPFEQSLNAGVGPTTTGAWAMGKDAVNQPAYGQGITGALNSYSKVAQGDYLNNMDPEYQAMIDRAANETTADVNSSMGANGRYGSNVHVGALVDQVGGMRTAANVENRRYEQQRQTEAAGLLPQLLQSGQLPAAITGQIGSAEDAASQAALMGQYDLHERKANANTDLLAKLTSILAGNAASSGQTSTTTQPEVPWWQTALGYVAGNAGQAMKFL
jgi:hypothetical protein